MDRYEVNVARYFAETPTGLQYRHYFKVSLEAPHLLTAETVFCDLKKRFPSPEFKAGMTRWTTTGVVLE